MQDAPQDEEPIGVVFDSSLDGGIDQVLALAILFRFRATGDAQIASLSTSRVDLQRAAFLDAVARFYLETPPDEYSPGRNDRVSRGGFHPIGMATDGTEADGTQADQSSPMISAPLDRVGSDGKPVYPHSMTGITDTAVPSALIRNGLSAQQEGNAAVVLAGLPTNLLSLLELPGGADWVTRKVQVLSVAGGRFDGGSADSGVRADVAGFRKLLTEWPTPVVMAGTELNEALPLPSDLLAPLTDSAADDPVADAVRAYRPLPYDAPTQTLAATLYAVGLDEDYFELSEPGSIAILDDGRTEFTPSPEGRHHYLTVPEDQRERVLQAYVQLLTEPPEPEEGR